jgi:PAS domain-containing protein
VTTDRDGEEAERVQAEIRERLLLATESARIGIWDWDVESGEVLWDRRMFELYGIDKDDSRTAIDAWISVIIPEDREQVDADVAAALEAGSGCPQRVPSVLAGRGARGHQPCARKFG